MRHVRHGLITGAAGAIGAALAASFRNACPSAHLTLIDVDREGAERVAAQIGRGVGAERWDLGQPDDLPQRVGGLIDREGPIDLLVNCAGIMDVNLFAATSWERGAQLLRIDLESPLRLMSLVTRAMVERGHGTVVNVTSMAAVTPLRGCAYYGAAKAGLTMASEIARLELSPHGVHVVTVLPGPVRSLLEKNARARFGAAHLARLAPTGDPAVLAERVVQACARKQPRVVYPALYDLASRFPVLACALTRAFSPAPSS